MTKKKYDEMIDYCIDTINEEGCSKCNYKKECDAFEEYNFNEPINSYYSELSEETQNIIKSIKIRKNI